MISKKTKALVAGILSAAMSATAIVPTFASAANDYATENGANESYAKMFESLYADVITNGQDNGYLSKTNNGGDSFGIPYHCVETLCVEAPDYGHETTSEAMSYIAWITAMHDVLADKGIISGSTGDLQKGWKTLEAMIPGWSKNSYGANTQYDTIWKQDRLKADTATEEKDPSLYPSKQNGVDAINPLYNDMKSAYGSDNGFYLMHWLADVDDWYGFGGGTGKFTFINTFQRGEEESCFETVPHCCIEELKYGMTDGTHSGMKAIFNGVDKVPEQYSFTNAPDAEDRAIQAIYFANNYGLNTGDLSALAGKMGDQCRGDMFDKYYKAIGCQDIGAPSASGDGSQHFLMAWYTSWGGALETFYGGKYDWAWQIGCSHSHQFYQNPLAAFGLLYDSDLNKGMKAYVVDAINGDATEITEIPYIPAGVGVLLYSETAGENFTTVAYTGETDTYTSKLVGSNEAQEIAAGAGYVLYNNYFILSEGGTVAAHRCYLPVQTTMGAPRTLKIGQNGTVSAIETLIAEGNVAAVKYVNLSGMTSDQPFNGVNIAVVTFTDGTTRTIKLVK